MSKASKIWLVIAASLAALGIIIFGVIMTMLKWDFLKLGTVKYETNIYEIDESFQNISIKTNTADITVLSSDDGKVKVACHESEKEKYSISVENDTLIINITNNKKWYDYIGISIGSQKITLYLPESEYGALAIRESTGKVELTDGFKFESIDISVSAGDVVSGASASDFVKIKANTGHISVSDISAGAIELSATTGDIKASDIICEGDVYIKVTTGKTKLTNVECKNLTTVGNTGDISLTSVIVNENISIKRSTGDVIFDRCDAAELRVVTDTGDVKGSLLTEKIFVTRTSTGKKNVPETTSGGICEITTNTGDIIINIK